MKVTQRETGHRYRQRRRGFRPATRTGTANLSVLYYDFLFQATLLISLCVHETALNIGTL